MFIAALSGCIIDYYNNMLSIQNNSNKKITVLYTNTINPSTENNVEFYTSEHYIILPTETKTIVKRGRANAWHEYISEGKEKKLFIYFFSADELKKYNGDIMNDLVRTGNYLKLIEYSEKELDAINWTLTYNDK